MSTTTLLNQQKNSTPESKLQAGPAEGVALSDVSETSLLTLFCRAIESASAQPILRDPKAESSARAMQPLLAQSSSPLLQRLGRGKVRSSLRVHIALRAKKYDEYVDAFLRVHPDGRVVNLGCGMDSRFERTTNGKAHFFDVDLPEVIEFKRHFFSESDHYHMLGYSVFDYAWMDAVAETGEGAVLFLAEGLFMYLEEDKVKALILEILRRFPSSELVCEVVNKAWVKGWYSRIVAFKMQRELHIGKQAGYQFGITGSREPEQWNSAIHFLDDWCYFDTRHKKLGAMKIFASLPFMRKLQWTVHYRLG